MQLNMVFFGKNGISSTSAGYVCDIAKELIKADELSLQKVSFVHTEASVANIARQCQLTLGYDEKDLEQILPRMERIVRFKRLMAWLREAIKERNAYYDFVASSISDDELLAAAGLSKIGKPQRAPELTEGEYIATLSRDERVKIYSLQSRAAALGKAVHENGFLTKARDEMLNALRNPGKFEETGRYDNQKIFITREPSLNAEDVDKVFFEVVALQRQAQKEFNTVMHGIADYVREENIRREREFASEVENYRVALQAQRAQLEAWRKQELRRVSNLKIVIPEMLKPVYEEVQNLSAAD